MNPRLRHGLTIALAAGIAAAPFIYWKLRDDRVEAPASRPMSGPAEPAPAEPSLLEKMGTRKTDEKAGADTSGPVASNAALERQASVIDENQRELEALKRGAAALAAKKQTAELQARLAEGKQVASLLNVRMAAFEKDLAAARRARPEDPIVQWLTAELLVAVGGEPEEILPYLQKAGKSGLKRPRLSASLAKVEFDKNHFQAAYNAALEAVRQAPKDPANWEIFVRSSFAVERFDEVTNRLRQEFPEPNVPEWVRAIQLDARKLSVLWQREQAQRAKESAAGNLPLVRFTVEHRQFEGNNVKVTGTGQVDIELFEDQTPAAVANFLSLAETGFYDGTLFYWAEAGHMVVGGDPNTKNTDPNDDGLGGPGYSIPDEFGSPSARAHFRGVLSTVQNGPRTAGSQFFITLVPSPEFDGNSTAFGRVVKGQDVLDSVTQGRTNRNVGQFGRIIPGDRLVKVTVVRKRPHAYTVTKVSR
jgi:cyclophilin family peptidyl-prolyl cis-trans isomerase